jgi:hypothetical protein
MFRAGARDVDLLRAAAERQEMTQSDFIRVALREKARRIFRREKQNSLGESNGPQAA